MPLSKPLPTGQPSIETTGDEHYPAVLRIRHSSTVSTLVYITLDDLDRLMLDGEATRRFILDGDGA